MHEMLTMHDTLIQEVKKCASFGCQNPAHAKGLCNTHYKAHLRQKQSEAAQIYKQHDIEQISKKELPGVRKDFFYKELGTFVIEFLKTSNPVDLKSWIEEKITLPEGNGYKGKPKMDFDTFPHMKQVLKLVDNPDCKKIVLCFAAQCGKTDTIASIAAYLTGYRHRRGLYVLPSATLFDKVRDTRLEPLMKQSEVGFRFIKNKNIFQFSVNFFALGLASSSGTLAEQTGTSWVILDELDEYDQSTPKAGDPVKLAERRMTASARKLLIIACTPKRTGVGYTFDHFRRAKRFVEEIQCPFCDGWFTPDFYKHFKWPKEAESVDFNDIEINHLAWLECPLCLEKITDAMHFEIVTKKKHWKDLDPLRSVAECGFHLPIYLTPNKTWSATVTEYLNSQHDPLKLDDFNNSILAKPVNSKEARTSDDIDFSRLRGDYYNDRLEIPEGVFALTAGIDIGLHEIWLILMGWAAQDKKYVIRSECIPREKGTAGLDIALDKATEICTADYRCKNERPNFYGGFIDSGYDTELIYSYCQNNIFWKPSKGVGIQKQVCVVSEGTRLDGTKITLYNLNTHMLNDILYNSLNTEPGQRYSITFAADAPNILFEHFINQEQKETGPSGRPVLRWGKIKRRADHLRDACLNALGFGRAENYHLVEEVRS